MVHVAVPGLPVVTEVVPQPVFVLHVTDPLTSCARPLLARPVNARRSIAPLRPFTSPYWPSIVAVNVTDVPYVDGFALEATAVLEVACVMLKLLLCELLELV